MKKRILGALLALMCLSGCGWKGGGASDANGTSGQEAEGAAQQDEEGQTAANRGQEGAASGLSDEYGEGCLFHFGVIPVKSISTGLVGYMDVEGDWLISPQFYNAEPFAEDGRARAAVAKGQWGMIDRNGQWVIEPKYYFLADFHDGLALAQNMEKQKGFLDVQGNFTVCEEWTPQEFSDGRAIVSSREGVGVIDTNLEFVISLQKEWWFDDFQNGYARAVAWGEDYSHARNFIDVSGNFLFEEPLKDYVAIGFNKWGYARTTGGEFIDKNGQYLFPDRDIVGLWYFCPGDSPEWLRTDSKHLQYVNMQGETLFTESADVADGDWTHNKLSYGYMVIQGDLLESRFKEGMGVTRVIPQLPEYVAGHMYGEFHADGYCVVFCRNSAAKNRTGPDSFHVIMDTKGQVVLDLREFDGMEVR